MLKDQDQSKTQLSVKRESFREEIRKQDLQAQYRKKRIEARSTVQPANVTLENLIPQLKYAFENGQYLYLKSLHLTAFHLISNYRDSSYNLNSFYLIENGYLNEVLKILQQQNGDMKEVFAVCANLCHSDLLKQESVIQIFKQIMVPAAQFITQQIQRTDYEEILLFLANLSAWANGIPDELINRFYILEYLDQFTNSSDSNLIRSLCYLYHAMFSNIKKELSLERRKQVLIVLFKITKRDDADMIHLELLHSIATVYQPEVNIDTIVLNNKAHQFIIASLNGEHQEVSLKILVKMSATDNPDLLQELIDQNILDIVYEMLECKVKIHRRCVMQIIGNLCYNNQHITNKIVLEGRFQRFLMRFMNDIDKVEKNHILHLVNNILCTGDDKTFKRIVDMGWLHMIILQFATVTDNKSLIEMVLFLMRLVIHSRDTNDNFVKAIIEEHIYKQDEVKHLVESYYDNNLKSQDPDVEVDEQLNKFLAFLN
ncbi:hypothetical protein pb186bvf_004281 [Paramecium bursaria]